LEQLDESLDALQAMGVADAETTVQLQRRLDRLHAIVTTAVGEVDRSGLIGNARSTAAWFAQQTKVPAHHAKTTVRNARSLPKMPAVAAAFAAGEINADHVRVLATAHALNADTFEKCEDELLDSARSDRFDLFKRHVTYWRQLAEPDTVEDDAEKTYDARSCSASRSLQDTVFVDATLDPVGGSIFLNELNRLEHLLWEDDQKTGASRTNQQRRADALVQMAQRSAATPADATRARVLVQVLVDYQTFHGRICELADGTVLTPGQVVSLLDDADIQRVVFDGPSQVLDVGHRQRLFTGATRTAVQLTHLECQGHESCDVRFDRCEIDHIEPYEWGGPTIQTNGRPLCKWHHR
jgi:hypothetical protein